MSWTCLELYITQLLIASSVQYLSYDIRQGADSSLMSTIAVLLIFCLIIPFAAQASSIPPPTPIPIEHRSLDEIYHAALKENTTLRVAWGGDTPVSGTGIRKNFESRFPGIKLDLRLELSKYLDVEIDRHYEASKGLEEYVDIAVIQSLQDFPRWKAEGRLLSYKASQWNDIYPEFVDKDGAYAGLYVFSFGSTVYNPDVYPNSSTLPTKYPEFFAPQFRDRIVLAYPNDDDSALFLFTLIVRKYGWGFMDRLLQQRVTWVRGTASPSQVLGAGHNSTSNQLSISFATSSAFATGVKSKLTNDVFMAWPQTGAIFARAKAPEAAKLFLNHLLDDEWQKLVGDPSVRFATRKSFDQLGVFRQKNADLLAYGRFLSNRSDVEEWRAKFEELLGPPQGRNPNCATSQKAFYGACSLDT